jgi:hypothetical protein
MSESARAENVDKRCHEDPELASFSHASSPLPDATHGDLVDASQGDAEAPVDEAESREAKLASASCIPLSKLKRIMK